MPIHTLQTIPQEPEETSFFSGLLEGLALDSGESPARLKNDVHAASQAVVTTRAEPCAGQSVGEARPVT